MTYSMLLLVFTCAFCAANCSFNEKLDKVLQDAKFKQIYSKHPKLHILVAGKIGVGKSTLVNALVGHYVAETGDSVGRVTKKVNTIKVIKDGIHLYVTDTPGLQERDDDDNGKDSDEILQEAKKQSEDVDVFLFCIKITDRFESTYANAMKNVTRIFGKGIWRRGLVALTHANMITEKEKFMTKLSQWEGEIRKKLTKIVNKQLAETIPIVPAGFKKQGLFDEPSWVSQFWIQGFKRMNFIAMVHLMSLNRKRIHESFDEVNQADGNPEDQPLVACSMSRIYNSKIQTAAQAIGGAVLGAVTFAIPLPGIQFLSPIAAYAGTYAGDWAGARVQNLFDWGTKVVDCSEAVIWQSVYTAFLEEYPEYDKLASLSET